MTPGAGERVVLVQVRSSLGAIRIGDVAEVLRPLATVPLGAGPPFLLGLSVIRGAPVPVIDLGSWLGLPGARDSSRFVTLRVGERRVALAVEGVPGIRTLDSATLEGLPPLCGAASAGAVDAVAALDHQLVLVLGAARAIPDELWRQLAGPGAA